MVDSQQLVTEMKGALKDTASSIDGLTWDKICKKYMDHTKVDRPEKVLWCIMSSYMVGQELKDEEMIANARRILSQKIPDLEERLPWYDLMFGIMDKGRFYDGTDSEAAGPQYFKLDDQTHQELTDRLTKKTALESERAFWAVRNLARDMGHIPGAQYNSFRFLNGRPADRPSEILSICSYLHMPMRTIVTVQSEGTVADMYIDEMRKELNLKILTAPISIPV